MISIIFATFNGEKTLPRMLDAFCNLKIPDCGMEILAVDNASTDLTRDVITSYQEALPITYLYEGKKGKNFALNQAIDIAQGDLYVFTDDDVVPRADWLTEISTCANLNSEYHIFAGRILPDWPKTPAFHNTFSPRVMSICYAVTDPQLSDGVIDPALVWGANMAIRAQVFKQGIRFNTGVGPNGSSNYSMGSETELTKRLYSMGYKSYFTNMAIVLHMIRMHQMPWSWMKDRARKFGRGSMFSVISPASDAREKIKHSYFGVPRYMYRQCAFAWFKRLRALLFLSRENYLSESWELYCLQGCMAAFREEAKFKGVSSK